MIALTSPQGARLLVHDDKQAAFWESVGYRREVAKAEAEKPAPKRRAAKKSSK